MIYRPRWRRAIITSLFFHILLFAALGWLAGKVPIPVEAEEPYLELELATEVIPQGTTMEEPAPSAGRMTPIRARVSMAPAVRTAPDSPTASQATAAIETFSAVGEEDGGDLQVAAGGQDGGSAVGSGTSGNGSGGSRQGNGTGGTGSSSGGRQITPPAILSQVDPDYPEWAKERGIEGTAWVEVQVLTNGSPGNIRVISSSGYDSLDEAAVAAVRKWRFVPAKDRGNPFVSRIKRKIVFQIKQ